MVINETINLVTCGIPKIIYEPHMMMVAVMSTMTGSDPLTCVIAVMPVSKILYKNSANISRYSSKLHNMCSN